MITLVEHKSAYYGPRTWHNAAQGVTLAYAVDHTTAGEKLTQKAAGDKIVKISPEFCDDIQAARYLYAMLRHYNCRTVNVAGNGIYTFAKHGFGQVNVNDAITNILHTVHMHWQIEKVVSGGQSGADLAGLIAAERIGIDSVGTWPKGFKMRFADGKDVNHTKDEIMGIIDAYL
jgi:hypothetical protein